jgi:hypothetical protein
VTFPAFQYQDHAIASYDVFRAARERGDLAPDSRFLVSIPTPFNAVTSNFLAEFGLSTECGLGRHSAEQLDRVAAAVAELVGTKTPALP